MTLNEYLGESLSVESLAGILPAEFSPEDLKDTTLGALEPIPFFQLGEMEGVTDKGIKSIKVRAKTVAGARIPNASVVKQTKGIAPKTTVPKTNLIKNPSVIPSQTKVAPTRLNTSDAMKTIIAQSVLKPGKTSVPAKRDVAVVTTKDKKPWINSFLNAASPKIAAEGVQKYPGTVPGIVKDKAKEIANGGFIGGKVGEKAKAVQQNLLSNEAEYKRLQAQMAQGQMNTSDSTALKTQMNRLAGKLIEDRARIERFRIASTLSLYGIVKRSEERNQQTLAAKTSGSEQERHLVQAAQHRKLADNAEAGAKALLTQPLEVPGLTKVMETLNTPSTLKDQIADNANRTPRGLNPPSQAPTYPVFQKKIPDMRTIIPFVRTTDEENVGVVAAMSSAGVGISGFEGIIGNILNKAKEGVSKATDFIGDAAGKISDIAAIAGPIASAVGGVAMVIPIPPLSQAVGATLLAAGAATTAIAGTAGKVKAISGVASALTASGKKSKAEAAAKALEVIAVKFYAREDNKTVEIQARLNKYAKTVNVQGAIDAADPTNFNVAIVSGNAVKTIGGPNSKGMNGIANSTWAVFQVPNMPAVNKITVLTVGGKAVKVGYSKPLEQPEAQATPPSQWGTGGEPKPATPKKVTPKIPVKVTPKKTDPKASGAIPPVVKSGLPWKMILAIGIPTVVIGSATGIYFVVRKKKTLGEYEDESIEAGPSCGCGG